MLWIASWCFSLQVKTQNKAKTETSSPRQKGREGLLKETNKSKPPVTVRDPNASASLLLLPLFLIGLRTCSTDLLRRVRGGKLWWSGPEQTQRNSGTEGFVVCAQVWVYRHIKAAAQPPWNKECCSHVERETGSKAQQSSTKGRSSMALPSHRRF